MTTTIWRRRAEYDVAYLDVFSGRAFLLAEACSAVLRRTCKPYVVNLHGGKLPEFARRHPRRVSAVLKHAFAATAPSPYIARELEQLGREIEVVPNSVAIANYPFRSRTTLRPSLVWIRAFHETYAPALAVRVLQRLAENHQDASLLMVGPDKGDGSLRALREQVAASGLEDRVRFVGPVHKADVPRWLNKGDIFLNTSRVDSFSVTVLEAMACGLGVVSTNVGGVPFLIEDEASGLLVPPDDEYAMTEAVRRLLDSPELTSRLSAEARRRAERFDRAAVFARWQEIFRSAIRPRS
jgi:glycosyltransferase involved in cell wall biosynthesis